LLVALLAAAGTAFRTGLDAVGPAAVTTRTAPDEIPAPAPTDARTPAGGAITLLLAPTTDHGPLTAGWSKIEVVYMHKVRNPEKKD
jgi:hypothetical protein